MRLNNEPELRTLAALEGRISFAIAAFALAGGLIILMDRIGLPEMGARWLALMIGGFGLGVIGFSVRAATMVDFHGAGRLVPPSCAGLAAAACIAGAALLFVPPLPAHLSLQTLAIGLALGLAGAVITAPVLAGSTFISVAGHLTGRFPARSLRFAFVALVATIGTLVALAGFEQALRLMATHLGVSRGVGAIIAALIILLMLVPGGMAGLVWAAAGAGGLLMAALGAPALVLAMQGHPLPLPYIGEPEVLDHALARMADWGRTGTTANDLWMALPIGLGIAAFAPLLAFAGTVRDSSAARRAQAGTIIWTVVIAAAALLTLALGTLGLDLAGVGQRADRLPEAIYAASAEGWVTICGQAASGPAQARTACAAAPGFSGLLREQDLAAVPGMLLMRLSQIDNLGGGWNGIALAAWVSACLALAAAGLHGAATALGHDLIHSLRARSMIASRRLASTRLTLILLTAGVALALTSSGADPRSCIGVAIGLCAALLLPLMLLGALPRARNAAAGATMIGGLAGFAAVLMQNAPSPETLAAAILTGFTTALTAGVLVALTGGAPAIKPAA